MNMKFNEQVAADQFKKNWHKNYEFNILKNPLENVIQNIKELERQNLFTTEMVMIFDNIKFAPLYVTKNIETILGYPQQQFLDWGKDALLNIGAFDEVEFWKDFGKWQNEFMELELKHDKPPTTFRFFCGGFCYKHANGDRMKFLFQSEHPIGANKIMPDCHFSRLKDIGHLLKEDTYWVHFEKYNEDEKISRFYSKDNTSNYAISSREKEVLSLIAKGMDSKDVAEQLFISIETVKTHRKNMINRFKAKDTSSLIQIVKLCELI